MHVFWETANSTIYFVSYYIFFALFSLIAMRIDIFIRRLHMLRRDLVHQTEIVQAVSLMWSRE